MQLYIRPFYNIRRQQNNFEWTREHSQWTDIKLHSRPRSTRSSRPRSTKSLQISINFVEIPKLYIVWTAGKNLALPETLNRNTPLELLTRKTTEEIPQNIRVFLAKHETSSKLECKYTVKTHIDQTQINNLRHFPLYLDCKNNHYEVDFLGNSTFKPIPFSSGIKNNTQQQPLKQKMYRTDLCPLIEMENLTDNINLSGPPDTDPK